MYGVGLRRLAAKVSDEERFGRDLTWAIAYHLAMAYAATSLLKEQNVVPLEFGNQELIVPSLVRAWRELLHVRKDLPEEFLDRNTISRFGRILE